MKSPVQGIKTIYAAGNRTTSIYYESEEAANKFACSMGITAGVEVRTIGLITEPDTHMLKLERRLARLSKKMDTMEELHSGNEQDYTYHGGFSLGYLKGQLDQLEEHIDDRLEGL